jgi:hypothetical protein
MKLPGGFILLLKNKLVPGMNITLLTKNNKGISHFVTLKMRYFLILVLQMKTQLQFIWQTIVIYLTSSCVN